MRFLIDVAHPVDAHFYIQLISQLQSYGHSVLVCGRLKDVTCDLLDAMGIPYDRFSITPKRKRITQAFEFVLRVWHLYRWIRKYKADVVLTRNPCGVWAAKLSKIVSIFDTTDGAAAKIHFRLSVPYATHVTSTNAVDEDWGEKHTTYNSQLHASYLHPNRFTPDQSVLDELGVKEREYCIVRFVAHSASHDHGESGLNRKQRSDLVEYLSQYKKVFIVSEEALPKDQEKMAFPLAPHKFLHALNYSSLVVGDGISTVVEGGFLGVPALWYSSYGEQLQYLNQIEKEYGLIKRVPFGEIDQLYKGIQSVFQNGVKNRATSVDRFYEETDDLIEWYIEYLERTVCKN